MPCEVKRFGQRGRQAFKPVLVLRKHMSKMSDLAYGTRQSPPAAPLRAHRYPIWLLAVACLLMVSVLYSLQLLPNYYSASRLVDRAETADAAQQIGEAVELLERAATLVPDSKKIQVHLAYEYFKLPGDAAHEKAMGALYGLDLSKDEMAKLRSVMPSQDEDKLQQSEAH
jgi:hypothetical protein